MLTDELNDYIWDVLEDNELAKNFLQLNRLNAAIVTLFLDVGNDGEYKKSLPEFFMQNLQFENIEDMLSKTNFSELYLDSNLIYVIINWMNNKGNPIFNMDRQIFDAIKEISIDDSDGIIASASNKSSGLGFVDTFRLNCVFPEVEKITILRLNPISIQLFTQCDKLSEVNIPNTVKEIGESAFYFCQKLTSIELPDSLETIDVKAFFNSALKSVHIKKNVSEIRDCAFGSSLDLSSITFDDPGSLKKIGMGAFSHCPITSITFPESLESIGDYAFMRCRSLENVILPSTLTFLGKMAFWGCSNLKPVKVKEGISKDVLDRLESDRINYEIVK